MRTAPTRRPQLNIAAIAFSVLVGLLFAVVLIVHERNTTATREVGTVTAVSTFIRDGGADYRTAVSIDGHTAHVVYLNRYNVGEAAPIYRTGTDSYQAYNPHSGYVAAKSLALGVGITMVLLLILWNVLARVPWANRSPAVKMR